MSVCNGCFDIHMHPAPDVVLRKFDDEEIAAQLVKAGMAGFMIKNHFTETASRAQLLQKKFPQLIIRGGLVLNLPTGGCNPYAVENCAKLGGRICWMPTMDARSYQLKKHPDLTAEEAEIYLYLLDEDGNLKPNVERTIEAVAKSGMALATGHISAKEGLAVLHYGKEAGVKVLIATHADNPSDYYTMGQRQEVAAMGGYIEHCFFNVRRGDTKIEALVQEVKMLGAEHVVFSSDVGQPASPYPDEAITTFAQLLLEKGLTQTELAQCFKINPRRILLGE